MAERANITPSVIKWARKSARMSTDDAASKIPVKVEKLIEWEAGDSLPTINQAQKLAKVYQRPFALFFLPEPPIDFHPLQDFRKKGSQELSTASVFIIREIQQKQAWVSEENQAAGEPKLDFVGKFSLKSTPEEVAKDILATLEIYPLNYLTGNPLKEWIDKAESKGIFISRTSFIHSRLILDKEEIQGFAIADSYAPFVFINSADWNAPQLFTLVHELAHIWIASTGISNGIEADMRDRSQFHPVELFCNEVAGNALMPEEMMKGLSKEVFGSSKQVFKVGKELGISSYALLVRALNLNIISLSKYQILKKESDKEFAIFLKKEAEKKIKQKKKEGGPSYFLLKLNRNSRLFTQIVIDGYRGGRIEPNLASSLLSVKSNKFHKLEEKIYG